MDTNQLITIAEQCRAHMSQHNYGLAKDGMVDLLAELTDSVEVVEFARALNLFVLMPDKRLRDQALRHLSSLIGELQDRRGCEMSAKSSLVLV